MMKEREMFEGIECPVGMDVDSHRMRLSFVIEHGEGNNGCHPVYLLKAFKTILQNTEVFNIDDHLTLKAVNKAIDIQQRKIDYETKTKNPS